MRRPIIRETVFVIGNSIEGSICPVHLYNSIRRRKCNPTSDVQKRLNQKNAESKLRRIVQLNFTEKDVFRTFTYSPDFLPRNKEEAQKEVGNFIRRVKRLYQKLGLELKYIYVTELGDNGRWHHHFIMSGGVKWSDIDAVWGKGAVNSRQLPKKSDGLVHYMLKERNYYRRWNSSRNIEQPEPIQHDGRISTDEVIDAAEKIELHKAQEWFEWHYPGFEYVSADCLHNDFNGGIYIYFRMQRKPKSNHTIYDILGSQFKDICTPYEKQEAPAFKKRRYRREPTGSREL